jgi:hypothetical protein
MSRSKIAGLAVVAVLVLIALAAVDRALKPDTERVVPKTPAITPATPQSAAGAQPEPDTYQGFIYGRITTIDGTTLTGRLRWGGGNEEAFWGDYFNGAKHENPWVAQVPAGAVPKERQPIEIFGFKVAERERKVNLGRQLMTPFGEIARIEARGLLVRVTLKSGAVFDLDRSEASDFDDDLRVWNGSGGIVNLNSLRIVSIELLPTPALGELPTRLHGTVRTRQGEFAGFLQWDRDECLGPDELDGNAAHERVSVRFDTIRSIARRTPEGVLVTLLDGRELALSGTNDVDAGNRGVYVDDLRYGRVLVSWKRPDLRRLPARGPHQGRRHHTRRPPPHRPAGLRPRRERNHRDARRLFRRRRLHPPLRAGGFDRAPRRGSGGRPTRQGDPPQRRGAAIRAHRRPRGAECRHLDLRRREPTPRIRALGRRAAGRLRPPLEIGATFP